MHCLIVANGDPPSEETFYSLYNNSYTNVDTKIDLLVALDGAGLWMNACNITPDVICGDFDSFPLVEAKKLFPNVKIEFLENQNQNDLEKGILYCMELGADKISILGALGKRIDHTLSNISLIVKYHLLIDCRIIDNSSQLFALSKLKSKNLSTKVSDTISINPFGVNCTISIAGVKWELDVYTMDAGAQGLSNVAVLDNVLITVHDGICLISHIADI